MSPDDLLTAREVAPRLRCSRSHVHRLADAGHIERVRLGPRMVRFRARSVDQLLARGLAEPKAAA
jgi:excisionase family DNA binding protein